MKRKEPTIKDLQTEIDAKMAEIAEIEKRIEEIEMKIVDCILDMYNAGTITLEDVPVMIKEKTGKDNVRGSSVGRSD
jgi:seryl-tRNA synthetase